MDGHVILDNWGTVHHLRHALRVAQTIAARYPEDVDTELVVALLEAVSEGVSVQAEERE